MDLWLSYACCQWGSGTSTEKPPHILVSLIKYISLLLIGDSAKSPIGTPKMSRLDSYGKASP